MVSLSLFVCLCVYAMIVERVCYTGVVDNTCVFDVV